MIKNLVIVESPAKAKTIEKFLGSNYSVRSSYGHVRDLSKNELSIDIEKGFKPIYQISSDKIKLVNELKKIAKEAETIWLATDEDREGEAISWHLVEALQLDKEKVKRIAFHEITKNAILQAINNPRSLDMNLVNAQQARRVLDRIVGYELSPLLWKKVKPALSAGRVQSVAVRLIVEREEEIQRFVPVPFFRTKAVMLTPETSNPFSAILDKKFADSVQALQFLEQCKTAKYKVHAVTKKPGKKSPPPPFTTSTLQQEASRKLGFSVARTMTLAQQLYESGKITYMRTDSVNLSELAIAMAKKEIETLYGNEYVKTRRWQTKTKGAQEAHEAIRPTYLNVHEIDGDTASKKLYELIWKRCIASQMSDAQVEKTTIEITISTRPEQFIAEGEVILFDGFLKLYIESSDDSEPNEEQQDILPAVKQGDELICTEIESLQKYTQPPFRYTEASLVKKLEELGIGRPSTYAPTISTIQKREYIVKGDKQGSTRNIEIITLKKGEIKQIVKSEKFGFDKGKLIPTDLGTLVNKFLMQYFSNIIDYQFTANIEEKFDEIAEGRIAWNQIIKDFYKDFHPQVKETTQTSQKFVGERLLGTDPVSGKNVYCKIGRFGPMVQIGEATDAEKPRFASLLKHQSIENLELADALKLFELPRIVGEFKGSEITAAIGRFGPYLKFQSSFYSLPKTENPLDITLEKAIEIIELKNKAEKDKIIKDYPGTPHIQVLNGRYGPFIQTESGNFKIPKGKKAQELSREECEEIINKQQPTQPIRKRSRNKK